jgi:hypothetical protein
MPLEGPHLRTGARQIGGTPGSSSRQLRHAP